MRRPYKDPPMPHDQPYLEAEQNIPTMIEGLQDCPDFKKQGNPNQVIK